jgi:hypothetical protein
MLPSVYGCSAQQSSTPPPPTPTITFSSAQTTTVNFGEVLGETSPVREGEELNGLFNGANSFTTGSNTLANYYETPEPPNTVNHSFSIIYDSSELPVDSLPADGECSVEIVINPLESFEGITAWNLETGEPFGEPGNQFQFTFEGLNRSAVSNGTGNIESPAFLNDCDVGVRVLFGSVPVGETRGFETSINIRLNDGTTVSATETCILTGDSTQGAGDASIKEFIV